MLGSKQGRIFILKLLGVFACALLSVSSFFIADQAKAENIQAVAICTITSAEENHTVEDCLVTKGMSDEHSWLLLEKQNGYPLLEEVMSVSIFEMTPGDAMVSGLTKNGNNSRWGEARKENNCWTGSDFRICITDSR